MITTSEGLKKPEGLDNGDLEIFVGDNMDTLNAFILAINSTVANKNPTIGTDSDINTAGAGVLDTLTMTNGVITGFTTRTLTAANIGAVETGDYSDTDVLNKVKAVDGSGSGLDADTVDGYNISTGIAAPTGGTDGDLYLQHD
jgi:hypothetical protein